MLLARLQVVDRLLHASYPFVKVLKLPFNALNVLAELLRHAADLCRQSQHLREQLGRRWVLRPFWTCRSRCCRRRLRHRFHMRRGIDLRLDFLKALQNFRTPILLLRRCCGRERQAVQMAARAGSGGELVLQQICVCRMRTMTVRMTTVSCLVWQKSIIPLAAHLSASLAPGACPPPR